MCCAVLSYVQLFGTPQTVAYQAPLSMRILQARILEWVAMPFSRGFSWPRDHTRVSLFRGKLLLCQVHKTLYIREKPEFGLTCPTFESWHQYSLSVILEVPYPKIHFYHLLSRVTACSFRRIKQESKGERRNSCELQSLIHNPKSKKKQTWSTQAFS